MRFAGADRVLTKPIMLKCVKTDNFVAAFLSLSLRHRDLKAILEMARTRRASMEKENLDKTGITPVPDERNQPDPPPPPIMDSGLLTPP